MTNATTHKRGDVRQTPLAHAPASSGSAADDVPRLAREPLWTLFRVVFLRSALAWGGLALMAQLELHYVDRERRFTRLQFSDLVALAWMVPGAVGCNVAVQVGHALRGGIGAWVAGTAAVLPFFGIMSAFAVSYDSAFVRSLAAPALMDYFAVVLGALIALTWYRQTRALVRTREQRLAAVLGCVVLLLAQGAGTFVLLLAGAFLSGWAASPARGERLAFSLGRGDKLLLAALVALVVVFALPLPPRYQFTLIWPRLAGAAMTLFGGGFSALPVLKTVFVVPPLGVTLRDFTLAFALSPVSPGPLLNVIPFLGYLTYGFIGAIAATLAFFVPSGLLIVFARRHLHRLEAHTRFEHGMRVLRATTTAFLLVAVVHIAQHVPPQPTYLAAAAFALLAFARLRMPVYAVYAIVALAYGASVLLAPHR